MQRHNVATVGVVAAVVEVSRRVRTVQVAGVVWFGLQAVAVEGLETIINRHPTPDSRMVSNGNGRRKEVECQRCVQCSPAPKAKRKMQPNVQQTTQLHTISVTKSRCLSSHVTTSVPYHMV